MFVLRVTGTLFPLGTFVVNVVGCLVFGAATLWHLGYPEQALRSVQDARRLAEDVGAGHVVLGTDHPFELRDAEPLNSVAATGLSRAEARAILWDTASGLLHLT